MSQEAKLEKLHEIYQRQAEAVYRMCCSFMESAIGAEAVVQETFLELAAQWPRLDGEKAERVWLLRRAAKLCRETLREGMAEYGEDAAHSTFSPELLALRELTAEQKLAAYLYYVDGFQMSEIAGYLHCPGFVIRNRLDLAKQKMRNLLPEGEAMMRRLVRNAYQSAELTGERKERLYAGLETRLPSVKRRSPIPGILGVLALIAVLAVGGLLLYPRLGSNVQLPQEPDGSGDVVFEDPEPVQMSDAEALETYADTLELYRTAMNERWDRIKLESNGLTYMVGFQTSRETLGYYLKDLDRNGIPELIVSDGTVIFELYTIHNGKVTMILSGTERNSYQLTQDDVLVNHAASSAASAIYTYYRCSGVQLIIDRRIFLDATRDAEHPWFLGFDSVEDADPISEEEAQRIMDEYVRWQIPVTLLLDPQNTAE